MLYNRFCIFLHSYIFFQAKEVVQLIHQSSANTPRERLPRAAKAATKYASHIRVPVSLFKNDIFLGLAGRNKADCLAILVVLLRYSNQKTGECYPRLAHMHSLLGLSKATIYRRIKLMVSIGLLKKKRLSSTNLYKLNPILMVGSSQGDVSDTSGGLISAVRLTGINKDNFNIYLNRNNSNNKMDNDNRIDEIINKFKNDKDVLISTLSKFLQTTPPAEHNKLLNNPTYKWYMKLVLELFRRIR